MMMRYKFYQFDEPVSALLIATRADEALLEYQEKVADIQDGVSFDEVSSSDFIEKLALEGTRSIPTIELGLRKATIEVQEALFQLAGSGEEAIVLTNIHTFI